MSSSTAKRKSANPYEAETTSADPVEPETKEPATDPSTPPKTNGDTAIKPRETGGREGPDPTRHGDWEKAGRCVDF